MGAQVSGGQGDPLKTEKSSNLINYFWKRAQIKKMTKNVFENIFGPLGGPTCHEPDYKILMTTDATQKNKKKLNVSQKDHFVFFLVLPGPPMELSFMCPGRMSPQSTPPPFLQPCSQRRPPTPRGGGGQLEVRHMPGERRPPCPDY